MTQAGGRGVGVNALPNSANSTARPPADRPRGGAKAPLWLRRTPSATGVRRSGKPLHACFSGASQMTGRSAFAKSMSRAAARNGWLGPFRATLQKLPPAHHAAARGTRQRARKNGFQSGLDPPIQKGSALQLQGPLGHGSKP